MLATPQKPLSRKTKDELLADYRQLQEQYEELKMTAKMVHDPKSAALLAKAGEYSADAVAKSIADLKKSIEDTLNDIAQKLLAETEKFAELQNAIALSKDQLELNYNIQVGAETLQQIINEYRLKQFELEEEITAKKRDWDREREEHDYTTKRERTRAEEEHQIKRAREEQELGEREQQLRAREQEIIDWQKQIESFPAQLEKAVRERENETSKQLKGEFEKQLAAEKKDWQAQKNIYEMRLANLEEASKRQVGEILALKQETERANKKAQELAIKVIEGSSLVTERRAAAQAETPATPH